MRHNNNYNTCTMLFIHHNDFTKNVLFKVVIMHEADLISNLSEVKEGTLHAKRTFLKMSSCTRWQCVSGLYAIPMNPATAIS